MKLRKLKPSITTMTEQNQSQTTDQQPQATEQPTPDTVDPRDLVYNEGSVSNPEEVLARPNVAPQRQADNEREF